MRNGEKLFVVGDRPTVKYVTDPQSDPQMKIAENVDFGVFGGKFGTFTDYCYLCKRNRG